MNEKQIKKVLNEISFIKTTMEELNNEEYQPFITDEDGNLWTFNKEHLINILRSI